MNVRAVETENVTSLKAVPLDLANNIPAMMRQLADEIECGQVDAQEMLCIVRTGINGMSSWAWGDYRGAIAALGLLEAAKTQFPVRNTLE